MKEEEVNSSRSEEAKLFFLTTAVVAPVLTILIVAGYGFTVWIAQIIMGPPGS